MTQKRPPTVTIGSWKWTYKQVPYEERYFFGSVNDGYKYVEVMKIPYYLFEELGMRIFPFSGEPQFRIDHFDKFLERVESHNKFLDEVESCDKFLD